MASSNSASSRLQISSSSDGVPFIDAKAALRLHLLLQGSIQGLELPPALLGGRVMMVCLPGLLQGPGAGLARGRQGCHGLRIGVLTLEAPEVDSHLQLTPLLHQPETLGFKMSVNIHEFSAESAQRAHCL